MAGGIFDTAVDQDGVVWFSRRVDDAPPVLSLDGEAWGSYLGDESRGGSLDPVQPWPNGVVWFGSAAHWDGATLSLAEPAIPWGESTLPATAPDSSA